MYKFQSNLLAIGVTLALVTAIPGCSNPSKKTDPEKTEGKKVEKTTKVKRDDFVPKGDRYISIALNETPSQKFDKAIKKGQEIGIQVATLPIPWDEVERAPGKYHNDLLKIANDFYSKAGIELAIELNPIDTNNLRTPVDLQKKAFDDPEVIKRYQKALDWVLKKLPAVKIFSLSIGNEVDGILAQDETKWRQYTNFYKAVSDYARQKKPGLKVGCKVMARGMLEKAIEQAKQLNASSDVIMITHYPLTEEFKVMNPDTIARTMGDVSRIYRDKPIYFMELGYPSSTVIGSSEEKQAEFIVETFKAWDQQKAHVKFICFVWLYDRPKKELSLFRKYYKLNNPNFLQYLASLGLCDYRGKEKMAFKILKEESKGRGW